MVNPNNKPCPIESIELDIFRYTPVWDCVSNDITWHPVTHPINLYWGWVTIGFTTLYFLNERSNSKQGRRACRMQFASQNVTFCLSWFSVNWATNPFPKFQILRDASDDPGMPEEKMGSPVEIIESPGGPGPFPWRFAVPASNQKLCFTRSPKRKDEQRWTWNQIEIQNWRLGTLHWKMFLQNMMFYDSMIFAAKSYPSYVPCLLKCRQALHDWCALLLDSGAIGHGHDTLAAGPNIWNHQPALLVIYHLSIHPSIHPSIHLSICMYIYIYIHMYIYIYIPSISHSCDALQQSPRSPSISPKKARATHPLPSASDLKPSLFPFAARCTMGYGGFSGMIVPTDEWSAGRWVEATNQRYLWIYTCDYLYIYIYHYMILCILYISVYIISVQFRQMLGLQPYLSVLQLFESLAGSVQEGLACYLRIHLCPRSTFPNRQIGWSLLDLKHI